MLLMGTQTRPLGGAMGVPGDMARAAGKQQLVGGGGEERLRNGVEKEPSGAQEVDGTAATGARGGDLLIFLLRSSVQWHLIHPQCSAAATSSSRTRSSPQSRHARSCPSPSPARASPHSVCLPVLGAPRTWNRTVCGLSCPACFTEHRVFKVHPCGSVCRYIVLFMAESHSVVRMDHTLLLHSALDAYVGCFPCGLS